MKCVLALTLVALASAGFMDKQDKQESNIESQMTAEGTAMKAALESKLAHYQTEEGKKEHEKAVKDLRAQYLKDAAEEMEWLADVAKDGVMDFGNGVKFPLLDAKSTAGLLPKGLPDFPTDAAERKKFTESLPVDAGTYSTMLSLKKNPSQLVEVAQEKYKGALSSLLEEAKNPQALLEKTEKVEEKTQSSVEVIKASPKAFKSALKAWERIVPQAASMLLQMSSSSDENKVFKEANDLSTRATALHSVVFDSVEQVHNKDQLMQVAQNRITSLLMRQAEASLAGFDSLEGCGDAKDFNGAEARCLCVADNICNKAGQAQGGDYCSTVSSATCMAPKNEREATEMSTV